MNKFPTPLAAKVNGYEITEDHLGRFVVRRDDPRAPELHFLTLPGAIEYAQKQPPLREVLG